MARGIPESLLSSLKPVTLVTGHYGVGKTNLSCNLAIDLATRGESVALIDLDIVNPYFRASEQRALLEKHDVRLVAPVFAEAGSSLDVPSLRGDIEPTIRAAGEGFRVIIDVGGDDAGAIAVGRYAEAIATGRYCMIGVLNRFRNLVSDPEDAAANLLEIERACHLNHTAIVDNSHLKQETTPGAVDQGIEYAQAVSSITGLPIVAVTVPETLTDCLVDDSRLYPVKLYVKAPWD